MAQKKFSVAGAVRDNYPEYWKHGIQTYPQEQCAPFCKVSDKWGVFSNFGNTPIVVKDICFKNSEQLFQILKFADKEAVGDIYYASGQTIKMKAKKWGRTYMRSDWGKIMIDVMKFVLTMKYEQNALFRNALEASKGMWIVEDQTSFRSKTANTWGAKLIEGNYVGPNLMGELLMELRDNEGLEYHLPQDIFNLLECLKDGFVPKM